MIRTARSFDAAIEPRALRRLADLRRVSAGQPIAGGYPTVEDGLRGLEFIESAVESSRRGSVWVDL
jgi:hypothetical protein